MIKKFRYKLVKKAEPGRKNGANGNYELYDVFFGGKKVIEKLPDKTLVDAGGYSEISKTDMNDKEIFINVDGWRIRHYKIIDDSLYKKEIITHAWTTAEIHTYKYNGFEDYLNPWIEIRALPETD